MQLGKPPEGFGLIEPDPIKALMTSFAEKWPRLPQYWQEIKDRLKQTGHQEGIEVPSARSGARLFIADGDPDTQLPTVKVAYLVLGTTLYIRMVAVVA